MSLTATVTKKQSMSTCITTGSSDEVRRGWGALVSKLLDNGGGTKQCGVVVAIGQHFGTLGTQ